MQSTPAEATAPSVAPGARPPSSRDPVIDWLRGLAIAFVVVNHLPDTSPLANVTYERIGVFTGAELFVLLSGLVLGMVHRRRIERGDVVGSTRNLVKRAWLLYRLSLAVVVVCWLVDRVPVVDASVLTSWPSQTGEVIPLYAPVSAPLDLVRGMLQLRAGPWQFNIIPLYIGLLLITPALLWLLRRRYGAVILLLASLMLYAVFRGDPPRIVPSQSFSSFPLVVWQVLFVAGLCAGWHSERVGRVLARDAVFVALGVITAIAAVYALSNPWVELPGVAIRLPLLPDPMFSNVYFDWFPRRELGLGRLVNALAFAGFAYELLSRFRRRAGKLPFGDLLPMLGRATLYVFVIHLGFMLVAHWTPGPASGSAVAAIRTTLIAGATLAGIAYMVRRRVLFGVIPR